MNYVKSIVLIIVVVVISGCSTFQRIDEMTRLTPDEMELLTRRARQCIGAKIKLTSEEGTLVNSNTPQIGYYMISGKGYAQYFVTWKLGNGQEITYEGFGNINSEDSFRRIHYGKWTPKTKY